MHCARTVVLRGLVLLTVTGMLAGCGQEGFGLDRLLGREKRAPAAPAVTTPAVPESQVAARVNSAVITREEYKRRLELLPPEARPQTPEQHKEFLEQLVREELIVQDATARGLERNAKVQRDIEDFRRGRLLGEFINNILGKVDVTPQDVESYYQRFKEGFKEPEQIRVRHIVTKTEEEANAVLIQALQGGDFAQLARERSVGAGKEQGGDIGYVQRAADRDRYSQLLGKTVDGVVVLAEPLEQAAFALQTGKTSSVVKGPDGFVVLKCEERKPARLMPLVEVSDLIKNGLLVAKQREAIETYLNQLRGKAQVKLTDQPLP